MGQMMRGYKQIIDYRKQGKKPGFITFEIGYRAIIPKTRFDDQERGLEFELYPVVTIEPEELHKHHDFRFVIGCRIQAIGYAWTDDFFSVLDRIAKCKPEQIVASCFNDNNDVLIWEKGEYRALVS